MRPQPIRARGRNASSSSSIGPRRSLSLTLSDTRVYKPQIRARLGTGGENVARGARDAGQASGSRAGQTLQGYLAHKKPRPP